MQFLKFIKPLSIIVGTAIVINLLTIRAFNLSGLTNYTVLEQYLVLLILAVLHFVVLQKLIKKWPKQFGFLFTGLSMAKMTISLLYLFPAVYPHQQHSVAIALNFVAAYFVVLIFEVTFFLSTIKTLNEI